MEKLVAFAIAKGATDARMILSGDIVVREELAACCHPDLCKNYGLSCSCPPAVAGPSAFRSLQLALPHAIVVRMVVPADDLFSEKRIGIMGALHLLVAGIEKQAVQMGYSRAMAFAGGSCKEIFCASHEKCRKLFGDGNCRHPEEARPSMSGFGVDVSGLMEKCGWPSSLGVQEESLFCEDAESWVAGLVLLG